ncbi:MAG: hypothetical protein KAV99_01590 [Candidatus Latescibacteria bacterium]|nr:hypothetical protein [Candidatus Latescibacterota bacterium]
MNSRERVLKALEHKEPDRIPLDLGSSNVTGITKKTYINLARYLGEEIKEVKLFDTVQQLALMDENILNRLEVDTRGLMPNLVRKNPPLKEYQDFELFTDEWGITWKMPKHGGFYFDLAESPLSGDITERDIDNFPWPDAASPNLLSGLEKEAQKFYQQGYAIILESLCAGIFEMGCRIRGYEQFYSDLAINPQLACKLMDKFVELKIEFYKIAAEKLGGYIQFVREGDDVAGQESPLISPEMYRRFIKPRHNELFKAQKEIFPQPFYVFFHSDGAIHDLIPDFIEIGVDVLNPVQTTAKDMNVVKVKKEFGREISFWGGGIDTQGTLPKGSLEEVKKQVKERIEHLAPGGGFIFGAVHNIQDDVPPENILAMWKTFEELREY